MRMNQEKRNIKVEGDFQKREINSSASDNSDEVNSMNLYDDTTSFSSISSYDISTSSLINSPLVSELLISHGLLEIGQVEDEPYCNSDSQRKISSTEDIPSARPVDSFQTITNWTYAEDNNFKCGWESCDMCFRCRNDLVIHVTSTHIDQDSSSYKCLWNGCYRLGKVINSRQSMLSHIRTHTHDKPHECDVCGKEFSRVENLKIHIRNHTGEKPYQCLVAGCNKAFTNSSDRYKHSKRHQVEKPFVCPVEGCDKKYTDPSSLRKHKRSNAHGHVQSTSNLNFRGSNDHRPYACKAEGCNKRYTDPSSLRKHKRTTSHGQVL